MALRKDDTQIREAFHKERERERETYSVEKLMNTDRTKLMKCIKPQIQETIQILSQIKKKKQTTRHIVVELLKNKDKRIF